MDTSKTKFSIALRRVWSLPPRTHRDLLPLISEMLPIEVAIQSRIIKFVKTLKESENEIVRYIAKYAATAPDSILGRNIRILSSKMSKTYEEMVELTASKVRDILTKLWRKKVDEGYFPRADVIKELLLVKENLLIIDFGSHRIMNI